MMASNTPSLRALLAAWSCALMGVLLSCAALAQSAPAAGGVLPVPALTGRVIDHTGTLSESQRIALDNKLAAFEQSKGSQLVVLMVPTTAPEDIASFANRIASTWKIGRKDIGDGLLLVVAKNDRKLRIEVARTLEGAVPDLAAKRVIDQVITPHFKQGDFAGGLDAGVNAIIALISPEQLPTPAQEAQAKAAEPSLGNVFWSLVPWFVGAMVLLTGVAGPLGGILVGTAAFGCVVAGLPVWWITHSELWTHRAALAGIPVIYFMAWWWGSRMKPDASVQGSTEPSISKHGWFQDVDWKGMGHGVVQGGAVVGSIFDNSSSSGSRDSGSSSSDFGSGGGGSFGGGGASGGW